MLPVFLQRPITDNIVGSLATMATDTSTYKLNRPSFLMYTLTQD